MSSMTASPGRSNVSAALARDRLGVPALVIFVMSAATPLTVVAGVVTTGYAVTGIRGIPLSFLIVGAVLALFSVGYVAMARYVKNAGAFYAYVSHGLGKPLGVGAAYVALLAYNGLQCGLYGVIGAATAPLLDQWFGVSAPWWMIALAAWALVAFLGVQRVDVNGGVLALLLIAEVVIILVFDAGDLLNPAGGQVTITTLSPAELFVPGFGAILALAVLAFVGFESAVVFSEEAKDPRRTVRLATYVSLAIIAVLYALSAWAMSVGTGADTIVAASRTESTGLIFNLAGQHFGTTVVNIGNTLFVTSLVAAMISFHNTTARYVFSLGRELVLPGMFGRTWRRTGAPRAGSLAQTLIGLAVIVTFAVAGWDPLVQLFFWGGTSGALGVLFLITMTSCAVLRFFARNPTGQTAWRRVIAPGLATIMLVVVLVLAVVNFSTLLGVPADHPLPRCVLAVYIVAMLAGIWRAVRLRGTRPHVYAAIGLGPEAITARTALEAPPATRPAIHADAEGTQR